MSRKAGLRFVRWVVLPVLGLLVGGLIASNLVLQTGVARRWIETRLERRSGFDWTVAHASWTPWSGVRLGGVKARFRKAREEVEPVYHVDTLQLRPYWGRALRGRLAFRELRMTGLRGAVPVELLAMGPAPEPSAAVAEPVPELAGTDRTDEKPKGRASSKAVRPKGDRKPALGSKPKRKPPADTKPAVPVAPEEPPVPQKIDPGLPMRVVIVDAELSLYSLADPKRRMTVAGLAAELPVSGEESDGWWSAAALKVGGEVVAGPFESKLQWSFPFLKLPRSEFQWKGLTVVAEGALRTRGAPVFQANARIQPGAMEPFAFKASTGAEAEASRVTGQGRIKGNLLQPRSWLGDVLVQAQGISLNQRERQKSMHFDQGSFVASMNGGNIRIPDIRLIGEQLSFLGNGLMLADGRMVGVLRVVADPENAEIITRIANGSFIAGGWTRSWLIPLETADRRFRDINLQGTVQEATVDVGRHGESLPVELAWQRMEAFIKRERAEENVLAPAPDRGLQLTPAQ